MPGLIDLYEAHAEHRDQFEVIAFHDATAKTFAELDEKLKPIQAGVWGGKPLPFPILMDATGETIKAFGIEKYPTTILIDPDGKLVGEAGEHELEAKLPKLPAAVRAARALDRGVSAGIDGMTLRAAAEFLGAQARVAVKLDGPALKAKGVDPEKVVPLTMSGRVTLRSWLDLLLAPDGLTVKPDGDGLLVTAGPPPAESAAQKACAGHINADVLDKPLDFELADMTLAEVAKFFEGKTTENFVLDPAARRAGTLDPRLKVSGSAKGVPLREGLRKLLEPLKLAVVVRDEVIVITPLAGR